jgi:hypothetical protein
MDKKPVDTVTLSKADMEAMMSLMKGLQEQNASLKSSFDKMVHTPATSHAMEASYAAKPSGEVAEDTAE